MVGTLHGFHNQISQFSYLFMYFATIFSACLDHTSLIGLLPWYAGRNLGLLGRGVLSWYGMAV